MNERCVFCQWLLVASITLVAVAFAIDALSQVNINTSSSPKSTNYDEIEAYGVKCRQAIGSNLNVEAGVGQAEEANSFDAYDNNNGSDRIGLFARISYALGAPKRLDCGRIYQLTVYRLQRELLLLNKQEGGQ